MSEKISDFPMPIRASGSLLIGADGLSVGHAINRDSALYIVRACNAFPKLVEALEKCLESLGFDASRHDFSSIWEMEIVAAREAAKSALSLAQGETK